MARKSKERGIEVKVSKDCWLAVRHPQYGRMWHRLLSYCDEESAPTPDEYVWIGSSFSRFLVLTSDITTVRVVRKEPR